MANGKTTIINLLPVKTGGGLQNCVSFVKEVPDNKYLWIVRENSILESLCNERGFKLIAVADSLLARLLFELTSRFRFAKGDVCFTYFGPPLMTSSRFLHNINGFAYSNLLYPNIDFWGFCSPIQKVKKKLIDLYRFTQIAKADEIIFETKLLLSKAKNNPKFNGKTLHVIEMAPSATISNSDLMNPEKYSVLKSDKYINVAYVAGAHPNKRIQKLIPLAAKFREKGYKIRFILTLPGCIYSSKILSEVSERNLDEFFVNVGPIPPTEVSSLLSFCEGMVNLALLESFSNNVVEAWALKKVLFITDDEWSRASCEEGAIYLNVGKIEEEFDKFSVLFDMNVKNSITSKGLASLEKLPNVERKINSYLDIIEGH